MPKGEHFKKENPRIHQVSVKLNKTELEKLKRICKEKNISIPEWMRIQLNADQPSKPVKPKPEKKENKNQADGPGNQISLF